MFNSIIRTSLVPKFIYRAIIRAQLFDRLREEKKIFFSSFGESKSDLIDSLKSSPIAMSVDEANSQHYEVPSDFFVNILGPGLKYSCCYYPKECSLRDAERYMLDLYCTRAEINDGDSILDLGCGWGSFTLFAAEKFPNSTITSISNSSSQVNYIMEQAGKRKLNNIIAFAQDVNSLKLNDKFDCIVSIEMFEHVRNYKSLMHVLSSYLNEGGRLFVHHFCHKFLAYSFDPGSSWMAKNFFSDGLMPSDDLLLYFQDDLSLDKKWMVNGMHYSKTCYHWLENLYKNKNKINYIFRDYYEDPSLMFQYWDLFIRSCAQLFSYNSGLEWYVTHNLFRKKPR